MHYALCTMHYIGRENENEGNASGFAVANKQLAANLSNEHFYNVQSQTCSRSFPFQFVPDSVKSEKNLFSLRGGNSRPVVPDANDQSSGAGFSTVNIHFGRIVRGVLDRVVDYVLENQLDGKAFLNNLSVEGGY